MGFILTLGQVEENKVYSRYSELISCRSLPGLEAFFGGRFKDDA